MSWWEHASRLVAFNEELLGENSLHLILAFLRSVESIAAILTHAKHHKRGVLKSRQKEHSRHVIDKQDHIARERHSKETLWHQEARRRLQQREFDGKSGVRVEVKKVEPVAAPGFLRSINAGMRGNLGDSHSSTSNNVSTMLALLLLRTAVMMLPFLREPVYPSAKSTRMSAEVYVKNSQVCRDVGSPLSSAVETASDCRSSEILIRVRELNRVP